VIDIVTIKADETCRIDYIYGAFLILNFSVKKVIILNQTKLNYLQATQYQFLSWWRNTCRAKYTGHGFSLL